MKNNWIQVEAFVLAVISLSVAIYVGHYVKPYVTNPAQANYNGLSCPYIVSWSAEFDENGAFRGAEIRISNEFDALILYDRPGEDIIFIAPKTGDDDE